jgi:hypothetical protein
MKRMRESEFPSGFYCTTSQVPQIVEQQEEDELESLCKEVVVV